MELQFEVYISYITSKLSYFFRVNSFVLALQFLVLKLVLDKAMRHVERHLRYLRYS